MPGQIRDKDLLDALEKLDQTPYSETVWRSVREGRNPIECAKAGGRWDDRSFDVLYTSVSRDGAIEERRFHLFRGQPIPPSRVRYEIFELHAQLSRAITFGDLEALETVGMSIARFGTLSYIDREHEYPRSQEIAEACFFLGADGIVVPGARHEAPNLVVFCEQDPRPEVELTESHGLIEWAI